MCHYKLLYCKLQRILYIYILNTQLINILYTSQLYIFTDDIRTIPHYVSLYWISYHTTRSSTGPDWHQLNLESRSSFYITTDTEALYFQDRPILQDNNTLLRPRYTTIVRFYVEPKYVYTADIFILICIFYIFML